MAKKIQGYIKLQIPANMANPSPPIGPALGQRGINIMEFCKSFNENTINLEKGSPIPTIITVYSDRSFSFTIKQPTTSYLLKKAANIKSGSDQAQKKIIGKITKSQMYEIAKIKASDTTGSDIEAIIRSIQGTARSIGLMVE